MQAFPDYLLTPECEGSASGSSREMEIPYAALNSKPAYLKLALEAYHPNGYYTFPSEDFIRSKNIRVNGQRMQVKVQSPKKTVPGR